MYNFLIMGNEKAQSKSYITIVDLETTGLDPKQHEILQVAAKRLSFETGPDWKKTLHEEANIFFKTQPTCWDVDPFVARLNGFDPDDWRKTGVRLPTALAALFPLLEGAYWVGSKPSFDQGFVFDAAKRLGWQFPRLAGHHPIDLTSAFVKLWLEGEISKVGQAQVMDIFTATPQTHRADDDVEGLFQLLKCL